MLTIMKTVKVTTVSNYVYLYTTVSQWHHWQRLNRNGQKLHWLAITRYSSQTHDFSILTMFPRPSNHSHTHTHTDTHTHTHTHTHCSFCFWLQYLPQKRRKNSKTINFKTRNQRERFLCTCCLILLRVSLFKARKFPLMLCSLIWVHADPVCAILDLLPSYMKLTLNM